MLLGKADRQSSTLPIKPSWTAWDVQPYWLAIASLWVLFLALVYTFANHFPYGMEAFDVYYQAGMALTRGEPLYAGTQGWIYLYPPLLAQLLMPVTASVDYSTAVNIWFGLNIALLVGALLLLGRYVRSLDVKWLWIAPIFFFPFWQALYLGQITIIMMALLVMCWVALKEKQKGLAGGILALAIWIKVFPALLVLYFLWKREWKVIRGVFAAGVALATFQILLLGPDLMIDFISTLFALTSKGQPEATYENLSVFAFASRLFQHNEHVNALWVHADLFTIARFGLTSLILGVTGYTLYRSRKTSNHFSASSELEYGLVLVTILLCGSTLWVSGLPPLLLIYIIVLRNRHRLLHRNFVTAVCRVSFFLITIYQPLIFFSTGKTLPAIVLSIGFYGVILLWLILVYLLFSQHGIRHGFRDKSAAGIMS